MQAGTVTTLLANPVLLLKRLCEVEGAELVKEEFIESASKKYYSRIIAHIGAGVYVEVIDRIYARAVAESDPSILPIRMMLQWSTVTSYSGALSQELTAGERETVRDGRWGGSWGNSYSTGYAVYSGSSRASSCTSNPNVSVGEGAWSFGHTAGVLLQTMSSNELQGLYRNLQSSSRGLIYHITNRESDRWQRPNGRSGPLLTGNAPAGVSDIFYQNSTSTDAITRGAVINTTQEVSTVWPSLANRPYAIFCSDRLTSCSFQYGGLVSHGGIACNIPIASYAAIRVGCNLSDDSEIIDPSPWEGIPLFPKIRSDANGYVAFYTDAVGDFGGGVMCGKVDTSRGNKATGSYAYILRNYIPSYSVHNNPAVGTSLCISGGEASAGKRMNVYTPNPPIQTDSVSGGPVVSDAFLYDDIEIRGIATGALGCNTGMTGGYMGWMEGKRYRMLTSGIMVQW